MLGSLYNNLMDLLGSWLFIAFLISTTVATLYTHSATFRYHFKFATYVVICSVTGLFMIPLSLRKPRDVTNVLYGVPIVRYICPLVGIEWVITGQEHLAKQFSAVVVSNHQSAWDFMLICELWPVMIRCACVAKRAIMYVFPFGLASWLCGTVFIDRNNAADSRTKISATAEQIQQNKTKMWIFPEGTRSKKAELLPFKKGAFHIAVQNKLPIVPVVISPYTFINDQKKIFNAGRVLVTIMPPVETANVEDVNALTESLRDAMNTEFMRLTSVIQKEAGYLAVNEHALAAAPVAFENGKRRS